MKATAITEPTHNPFDQTYWASGLRENFTSRSYGEGLETGRNGTAPVPYPTFLQEGFDVCRVSSVAGARYRDAMFNSWDKNDPKDAQAILELLKQGITQQYHDPLVNGTHDLEEISKTYELISRARTKLRHGIITQLPAAALPGGRAVLVLQSQRLVRPLPYAVSDRGVCPRQSGREEFIAAAWRSSDAKSTSAASWRRSTSSRRDSVALPLAADSIAVEMFRLQLSRYDALNQQRNALEARAHALLRDRHDYQRLCEIPGIGPIIALVILAEGGDLRRFSHHKQFLKYCGLDLAKVQSRGIARPRTPVQAR